MTDARTALRQTLVAWNDLDTEAIEQDEYDAINHAALAVLGEGRYEALSTLTVRERWSSEDAVRDLSDAAMDTILARMDAVIAE